MSGHSEGLNIVAPNWKEEEFAANTQKVMYVIHSLLPQCIREKAGYVSFTREAIPSVPFYFSPKVCGTYSYSLSEKNGWDADWDALDQYFIMALQRQVRNKILFIRTFSRQQQSI